MKNASPTSASRRRAAVLRSLRVFSLTLLLAGVLAAALLARDPAVSAQPSFAAGSAPAGQSTLGDTVWHDANADGLENPGESGIGGVILWLYKDNNDGLFEPGTDTLVAQAITGDNSSTPAIETGWYDFQIYETGIPYWVFVPTTNFATGGALAGYVQTNASFVGAIPLFVYLPSGVQDYNDADIGFARPGISLVKRAGDTPDGRVRLVSPPGATITYSYVITNTGELPLGSLSVRDDNGTPGNLVDDVAVCVVPGTLAPGGSTSCWWSVYVSGDRTNLAVASGAPLDPYDEPYPVGPVLDEDDAVVMVGFNTPTPTVTGTSTSTATFTPTPTATASSTSTPTDGPSPTPTDTRTPTATPTTTDTPTATATPSSTPSPSVTPTASSTPTASITPTPTATCPPGGCVYRIYLPIIISEPAPTPSPTPTLPPTPTPTATVEVLGLAHPKDVVVREDTQDIYVTSRDNNRVYQFDGVTLAEEGSAVVGSQPWGVDYNPATNKLYVANFGSGDVRVFDASTLALLAMIDTGPSPTFVRVNPNTNKVYAVLYGANVVAVIDGATDTLLMKAPAGGGGSWGLALNPGLNRVYVSNRDSGTVTTLDGNAGYIVLGSQTRVACGGGGSSPYGMDFNPTNNRLYVACAPNGSVNTAGIYKAGASGLTLMTFAPLGNGGPDGGGGVAADMATGRVYFTNGDANTVTIIDANNQVAGGFGAGSHPFGIDVDMVTGRVYIVNRDSNNLTVH